MLVIIVLTLLVSGLYNNFFTRGMLVGVYVNRNYQYKPFLTEIPYVSDTLQIFEDGKFFSPYWGVGQYELSSTLVGTKIRLRYNYEFGKASFNASVERKLFGNPKIILSKEQNHYYEKIK